MCLCIDSRCIFLNSKTSSQFQSQIVYHLRRLFARFPASFPYFLNSNVNTHFSLFRSIQWAAYVLHTDKYAHKMCTNPIKMHERLRNKSFGRDNLMRYLCCFSWWNCQIYIAACLFSRVWEYMSDSGRTSLTVYFIASVSRMHSFISFEWKLDLFLIIFFVCSLATPATISSAAVCIGKSKHYDGIRCGK